MHFNGLLNSDRCLGKAHRSCPVGGGLRRPSRKGWLSVRSRHPNRRTSALTVPAVDAPVPEGGGDWPFSIPCNRYSD